NAAGDLTIEADSNKDGEGNFTYVSGYEMNVQDADVSVTANDLIFSGNLDTGTGNLKLLVSDGGSIGLGNADKDYDISKGELSRMAVGGTTQIGDATSGDITVNNIEAADSDELQGMLTLDATRDDARINFETAASTFNRVTAKADDGITVDVNLTTTQGDLILNADIDETADSDDSLTIADGVEFKSAQDLQLRAETGKVTSTGSIDLEADRDITLIGDVELGANLSATALRSIDVRSEAVSLNQADLTANEDITIRGDVTASGDVNLSADENDDGAGEFSISTGEKLTSATNISLQADDVSLYGELEAKQVSITPTLNQDVGIGDTESDLSLSKTEISRITTEKLVIGGAESGSITVNNIEELDGANIDQWSLDATANGESITFATNDSSFTALEAKADDGIKVEVNVTTTVGDLALNADADDTADAGGDKLEIFADKTLSSAKELKLETESGQILGRSNISLDSVESTLILADFLLDSDLTIEADTNADGVGSFELAADKTLDTQGNNLNIQASDIALNGDIDASEATVNLSVQKVAGEDKSIGLGLATRTFNLDGDELENITADTLNLGGIENKELAVAGVTSEDSANIGQVNLIARGYDSKIIIGKEVAAEGEDPLVGAESSSFRNLKAVAKTGIDINGSIEASEGTLELVGNSVLTEEEQLALGENLTSETEIGIKLTADTTLTAKTDLTLEAVGKGIRGSGALNLNAENDITVKSQLASKGVVSVTADSEGNGAGDLTFASAVSTSGKDLVISANDVVIEGPVVAQGAKISFRSSDGEDIFLGGVEPVAVEGEPAVEGLHISATELSSLKTGNLVVGDETTGNITATSLTEAATSKIDKNITLKAINDGKSVTINGEDLVVSSLDVVADNGVAVEVNLETTSGDLNIESNADGLIDGETAEKLIVAKDKTFKSTGNMQLGGKDTPGAIEFKGSATLVAGEEISITDSLKVNGEAVLEANKGITIDKNMTATKDISINADADLSSHGQLKVLGETTIIRSMEGNLTAISTDIVSEGTMRAKDKITLEASQMRDISIGNNNSGAYKLDEGEFSRLIAKNLDVSGGSFEIQGFDMSNISKQIKMEAKAPRASIKFNGNDSYVNDLVLSADKDITLAANIIADGSVFADADSNDDAIGKFTINQTKFIETNNENVEVKSAEIDLKGSLITGDGNIRLYSSNSDIMHVGDKEADLNEYLNDYGDLSSKYHLDNDEVTRLKTNKEVALGHDSTGTLIIEALYFSGPESLALETDPKDGRILFVGEPSYIDANLKARAGKDILVDADLSLNGNADFQTDLFSLTPGSNLEMLGPYELFIGAENIELRGQLNLGTAEFLFEGDLFQSNGDQEINEAISETVSKASGVASASTNPAASAAVSIVTASELGISLGSSSAGADEGSYESTAAELDLDVLEYSDFEEFGFTMDEARGSVMSGSGEFQDQDEERQDIIEDVDSGINGMEDDLFMDEAAPNDGGSDMFFNDDSGFQEQDEDRKDVIESSELEKKDSVENSGADFSTDTGGLEGASEVPAADGASKGASTTESSSAESNTSSQAGDSDTSTGTSQQESSTQSSTESSGVQSESEDQDEERKDIIEEVDLESEKSSESELESSTSSSTQESASAEQGQSGDDEDDDEGEDNKLLKKSGDKDEKNTNSE
ncbi:MAG: hypothetical protein GWP59_01485, partial [Chlamydiales bacterium]|nr:hypothetical protein [Chlamydiales bacterium]